MPRIIQFTHPGAEHGPDSDNRSHKGWNTGVHRRKFMRCLGDYVGSDNRLFHNESLLFWGEWEPPSHVQPLPKTPDRFLPKWLHNPYVPTQISSSAALSCSPSISFCQPNCGSENFYQNTDPFVFEDCFKYFICKQAKCYKRGSDQEFSKTTDMAKLDKGSIILFGSTDGRSQADAFFQLDTVFVIGDSIEYDPAKPESLRDDPRVSDLYYQLVVSKALPQGKPNSMTLRLYLGATFDHPVDGMYSFSPARVWGEAPNGFPRVQLQNLPFLTNNLNSAPRYFPQKGFPRPTREEQIVYWNTIRDESRKQGCVEGVRFSFLKERELHDSKNIQTD